MFKNPGTKWPILIALSIVGVIGACVWTIKVALNNPVEMSDYGMQSYHEYDQDVNDIINAKIKFDALYTITFDTKQISMENTQLAFALSDKNGTAVNTATIEAVLTRPDTKNDDIKLGKPEIDNGVYTFPSVTLPKEGRWDILTKITVGENQRYYNLKADTRNPNTFEF